MGVWVFSKQQLYNGIQLSTGMRREREERQSRKYDMRQVAFSGVVVDAVAVGGEEAPSSLPRLCLVFLCRAKAMPSLWFENNLNI